MRQVRHKVRKAATLPARVPALIALLLFPPMLHAGVALTVRIDTLEGPEWRLEGVSGYMILEQNGSRSLQINIDSMTFPPAFGVVRNLVASCPDWEQGTRGFQVRDCVVTLQHPRIGSEPFRLTASRDPEAGLIVSFNQLPVAGGQVSGAFSRHGESWKLDLTGAGLALASLKEALAPWFSDIGLEADGAVEVRGGFSGLDSGLQRFRLDFDGRNLAFSEPSGRYAGEAVAGVVHFEGALKGSSWTVDGDAQWSKGAVYLSPLFLDLGQGGLRQQVRGTWEPRVRILRVTDSRYEHRGVFVATGTGTLRFGPGGVGFRDVRVEVSRAQLPDAYDTYFQPWVIGTALDDLETSGYLDGSLSLDGTVIGARIGMKHVAAEDRQGRFGLRGVDADLKWSSGSPERLSHLEFEEGNLYGIAFGPARLALSSEGGRVHAVDPVTLPVMGGEFRIAALEVAGLGSNQPEWGFDAALTPVSMERVTAALGWPRMRGQLSGMIPDVRYRRGVVAVGGALRIHVFDGDVIVTRLSLEHPLGPVPRVAADVAIRDLDLDALTHHFSFGRIEGRLDGAVMDLELVDWEPVQFDLSLGTPENDDSRHRISQRAVDTISGLGSGVSGAVSGTFLRVFKNFSYAKLGLRCRLRRGVCQMDGIGPAPRGGYYLVKGAGLPRIDVIGYDHDVDWTELVSRLKEATRTAGGTP